MFQSSRMASGNCRLQDSMASSPFSASVIWKSRPSRIRRATLRMTLESSTTKQVFITPHSTLGGRTRFDFNSTPSPCSCRGRLDAEIEDAVDIENYQKLAVEPVHPSGETAEIAVEIDRVRLALGLGELQDFADDVDQKAERFALGFDADRHRQEAVIARAKIQLAAQLNCRDDATAQIEHARDLGPGERDFGDAVRLEHVLHALDRQAEQLVCRGEGDVFAEFAAVAHGRHAARLRLSSCSLIAATRPARSNLATKSWKPMARPRSIASVDTMAASAMIGISAIADVARTASASAKPSMSGISMSVTMRSKRVSDLSAISASAADAAATTR